MCCSSNRGGKRYSYSPEASPWNRKALFTLWGLQLGPAVIVSAVSGGLIALDLNVYRGDDGLSSAFYVCTSLLMCGVAGLDIGFFALQVYWYRNHKLHPGWALSINVFNVVLWLAIIALAAVGLSWSSPEFGAYEGMEVLQIICAVPFLLGLVYHSIVYDRFRKNRRRRADIEFDDVVKPTAVP